MIAKLHSLLPFSSVKLLVTVAHSYDCVVKSCQEVQLFLQFLVR